MSLWQADFTGVSGIFDGSINFPGGVINRHSHVLASVTELSRPPGEDLDFPFKGDAVFTLHNVVPLDSGRVQMTIDTGFGSPINVRAYIAVDP